MSIFGNSRDGGEGSFKKRNFWKLKDGRQVYRILPALGNLAKDGIWSKYYSVHFGYKNSKGKMRVFQSTEIKDNKSGLVTVKDAAKERIAVLRTKFEEANKTGDKKTAEKLKEVLNVYNLDNNHYVNAMDAQGNIGVLKLRHRAKQALDTLIKKLKEEGVDPRDPVNGRFVVFERSGRGTDTQFSVSVLQEDLEVPGVGKVKRDVVSTLTPESTSRMVEVVKGSDGTVTYNHKEAVDLATLFRKLTSAEVERIVKEGATAIDDIFETKTDTKAAKTTDDSDLDDEYGLSSTETETTKTETKAITGVDSIASSVPTKTVTVETVSEQSDEDFFKSLGVEL